MAFEDPQTIGTEEYVRLGLDLTSGKFGHNGEESSDNLIISHQYGKRYRHTARIDYQTYVSDPITPANKLPASMSAYFVVDVPPGLDVVTQQNVAYKVLYWLQQTNAGQDILNMGRVIRGES